MYSPSSLSLKLKMQSHLWTICFLIYYFPPLHWWVFSFFCQANSLAPVYLRYVNMLFLFWALSQPIVFSEIKHQGFLNVIFFVSPGNVLYLYILSSSFCCSSVHFMTLAKFRIASYFPVLSRSFSRWEWSETAWKSSYTWWVNYACEARARPGFPRGGRGLSQSSPQSSQSPLRAGHEVAGAHDKHSLVLGLLLLNISFLQLGKYLPGVAQAPTKWSDTSALHCMCCPQPAAVTAGLGCTEKGRVMLSHSRELYIPEVARKFQVITV